MGNKSKFSIGGGTNKSSSIRSVNRKRTSSVQQQQEAGQPPARPSGEVAATSGATCHYSEENPAKITHSFWLEQHSWLHQSQSQSQSQEATCEIGESARRESQPQERRSNKLLARWTSGLVRTFGGGGHSHPAARSQQADVGAEAAVESQKRESRGLLQRAERFNGRLKGKSKSPSSAPKLDTRSSTGGAAGRWFTPKSPLSSSTSTLLPAAMPAVNLPPVESKPPLRQQQQARSEERQRLVAPADSFSDGRSRSSCSAHAAEQVACTATPTKKPHLSSGSTSNSPYRQIARLFAGKSPVVSRKKAPAASVEDPNVPPSDEPAAGKRSRLVQFATKSERHASTGGLLSNLFVSPLFRRRDCGSSCCSSSAASGEIRGDEPLSGGAKRKRKKRSRKDASVQGMASGERTKPDKKQQQQDRLVEAAVASPPDNGRSDGLEFQARRQQHYANEPEQVADERSPARDRPIEAQAATQTTVAAQSGGASAVLVAGRVSLMDQDGRAEDCDKMSLQQQLGGQKRPKVGHQHDSLVACEQDGTDPKQLAKQIDSASCSPVKPEAMVKREQGQQPLQEHASGQVEAETYIWPGARPSTEAERSLLPLIRPLASSHSSSFGSLLSMNLNSSSQQVGGQVGGSAEALRAADDEENEPPVAATDLGVTRELVDCEPPAARADNNDGLHVDLTDASERPASLPAAAAVVDVPGGGTSKQLMATMSIRQKQTPAPAQTTSGVGMLKSNFKKLVKRQQSVDSYRMARDLKNKLKRQHGADRNKHQSNEAIKTKSVGDDSTVGGASGRVSGSCNLMGHSSIATTKQQTAAKGSGAAEAASKLRICIDPYAKPGSFTLPGESAIASEKRDSDGGETEESPKSPRHASGKQQAAGGKQQSRGGAQPPNTLSLMPSQQFIVGSFSGCITPTYPTHHLPSPKYAPASTHKKYSNASSTLSSSLGADSSLHSGATRVQLQQQHQQLQANGTEAPSTHSPADTECSLIGQGQSPMNLSSLGGGGLQATATLAGGSDTPNSAMTPDTRSPQPAPAIQQADHHAVEQLAAEEAARRAQLAEHIYDNKCGLGEDMKFLASLPELCDITFLVGETREPVCAVKSVLAARSRVFNTILFGNRTRRGAYGRQHRESAGASDWASGNNEMVADSKSNSRRDSSPKGGGGGTKRSALSLAKSSSPSAGRSTSPNAGAGGGSGQQQWSVTADASGYNPQTPSPQMGESAASHERGRFSVTSQGRDSSSGIHTGSMGGSQGGGSQQPLIIGPGQTATPAPASKRGGGKSKKGSIRDSSHHGGSRLTRMFTKRASDPSIKHSNNNHVANQSNYLDKMSSSQMSTTMIIEEFEPDVFRQLIEYIHTGCVLLQARTLLGLLNAADYYGLDQLRKACLRFVTYCITVDTVCSLLSTAERYIQYKCTKSIVQKVLEFVDTHADEIFKLNAFGLLPEHVVRLILARDGLQADEQVKYNGVYTWCEHYCRSYELTNIADVMSNFLDLIQFHKIPTNILLGEIYPTRIVPDNIFLSALAYQADPQSFEPQPSQARRMTLPNPTIHKTSSANEEADNDNDNDDSYESRPHDGHARAGRQSAASATTTITTTDDGASRSDSQLRLQPGAQSQDAKEPSVSAANKRMSSSAQSDGNAFGGSQQQLASSGKQRAAATGRAVRSRKSTGGQPEVVGQCAAASSQASGEQPLGGGRSTRLRKGSIAQMSINGMVRLSHKLSIKKRLSSQQPAPQSSAGASEPPASYRRRLASLAGGGDHYAKGSSSSRRKSKRISKQQSAVGSQHSGGSGAARDPLQLGQQILDAYLEEQRQRELREEARKRREQLESQMVEEAKRRAEQPAAGSAVTGAQTPADSSPTQHHHQHQARGSQGSQQSHKPIVKSLSTRKSFKDFKHISRRIFMRRSSSKMLQLQQQQQTPAVVASNQPQVSSAVAVASVVTNSQQ